MSEVQGYFAHKKTPTTLEPPRILGIGLRQGPRGVRFLEGEVPLYGRGCEDRVLDGPASGGKRLQG